MNKNQVNLNFKKEKEEEEGKVENTGLIRYLISLNIYNLKHIFIHMNDIHVFFYFVHLQITSSRISFYKRKI